MKRTIIAALLLAGTIASGTTVGADRAQAQTEETVTAYLAWTGSGRSYETGPDHAVFVGAITGPIYVETDHGLVPSGSATCPVLLEVETSAAKQTANGRCTIETTDGDRIYAEIACSGVFRVGCDGTMTLTGGTGAFEGIAGSGPITVRSERRSFVESREGVTEEQGAGIMIIDGLSYTLP